MKEVPPPSRELKQAIVTLSRAYGQETAEQMNIPEGVVRLEIPLPCSEESLNAIEEWFAMTMKRYRRFPPIAEEAAAAEAYRKMKGQDQ